MSDEQIVKKDGSLILFARSFAKTNRHFFVSWRYMSGKTFKNIKMLKIEETILKIFFIDKYEMSVFCCRKTLPARSLFKRP
jgi:hypothetical protein